MKSQNVLQNFIDETKKSFIKQSSFEVTIVVPKLLNSSLVGSNNTKAEIPGDEFRKLSFKAFNINTPATQFSTADNYVEVNEYRKFVYDYNRGIVTASFYNDSDYNTVKLFEAWKESVFDVNTRAISFYDDYIGTMYIDVIRKDGSIAATYAFEEVYPKVINEISYDWSQSQTSTVTITFEYSFYAVIEPGGRSTESKRRRSQEIDKKLTVEDPPSLIGVEVEPPSAPNEESGSDSDEAIAAAENEDKIDTIKEDTEEAIQAGTEAIEVAQETPEEEIFDEEGGDNNVYGNMAAKCGITCGGVTYTSLADLPKEVCDDGVADGGGGANDIAKEQDAAAAAVDNDDPDAEDKVAQVAAKVENYVNEVNSNPNATEDQIRAAGVLSEKQAALEVKQQGKELAEVGKDVVKKADETVQKSASILDKIENTIKKFEERKKRIDTKIKTFANALETVNKVASVLDNIKGVQKAFKDINRFAKAVKGKNKFAAISAIKGVISSSSRVGSGSIKTAKSITSLSKSVSKLSKLSGKLKKF